MTDEIKDRNIRDIRELARAVSDELSRENPKYIDSLRDHFAGLAMQGAMVNTHGLGNISKEDRSAMLYGAAAVFYEVADAMIAAREQRT